MTQPVLRLALGLSQARTRRGCGLTVRHRKDRHASVHTTNSESRAGRQYTSGKNRDPNTPRRSRKHLQIGLDSQQAETITSRHNIRLGEPAKCSVIVLGFVIYAGTTMRAM